MTQPRDTPTQPGTRGPVITLAASGIDHDAALSALTVAALRSEITQDGADLAAAIVRADRLGVTLAGPVRSLVINAMARICGEGR